MVSSVPVPGESNQQGLWFLRAGPTIKEIFLGFLMQKRIHSYNSSMSCRLYIKKTSMGLHIFTVAYRTAYIMTKLKICLPECQNSHALPHHQQISKYIHK